jgi:hypothetical protein
MMSLSPPTPVMLMVRELNSVCPRRILARRAAAASSVDASAQEAPPFADYARKVSTKSGEDQSSDFAQPLAGVGLSSNCLHCQGQTTSFRPQRVRCFIMALRMVSSFRIQAVRATFLAFPASHRRW